MVGGPIQGLKAEDVGPAFDSTESPRGWDPIVLGCREEIIECGIRDSFNGVGGVAPAVIIKQPKDPGGVEIVGSPVGRQG